MSDYKRRSISIDKLSSYVRKTGICTEEAALHLMDEIMFLRADVAGMHETANGAFLDGRNNAIAEREQEHCEWTPEDEGSEWYSATCGMSFIFNDDGPAENGFNFCPKCGKKLKEIPWNNSEDDADRPHNPPERTTHVSPHNGL